MFFKHNEKELAKKLSRNALLNKYEQTERKLQGATKTGDLKKVKSAMNEHHTAEYALLYSDFNKSQENKRK